MAVLFFIPFPGSGGGGDPSGPAGGDLRDNYPNPETDGIQGVAIVNEAVDATARMVMVINDDGEIEWRRLTQDDILPGFDITSFAKTNPNGGTLLYQRGATITGVTASASYAAGPPTSASISNTLGGSVGGGDINPGAWTINAPYAAGSMGGSCKRDGSNLGADPTLTCTLNAALGALADSASFTVIWTSPVFWGVGPAGYNSQAEIESLANTLLSTAKARTLTLSPNNQKVYYAYPQQRGTSSWTLEGIGVDLLAPIIVSMTLNGVTRDYYLYETTNLLTGSGFNFVVT